MKSNLVDILDNYFRQKSLLYLSLHLTRCRLLFGTVARAITSISNIVRRKNYCSDLQLKDLLTQSTNQARAYPIELVIYSFRITKLHRIKSYFLLTICFKYHDLFCRNMFQETNKKSTLLATSVRTFTRCIFIE